MMKRLLLGTATALVAATGAQAADLPVAPAVDYVRICDTFGTGFFYIPGTETCLRLSGRVRFDLRFAEETGGEQAEVSMRARARLNVDTRTQTAYGALRAFMRIEFTDDSAPEGALGAADSLSEYQAFIQFVGFTFGRTNSFFDFYTGYSPYRAIGIIADDNQTLLAAYTASFGNGVTATLSIEDGTDTRMTAGGFVYGGHIIPDVVAAIRVRQGWGSAQVMAALHEVDASSAIGFGRDPEYGFAVGAGVTVNLPMVGVGSEFSLQAAYADGALSYLGLGNVGVLPAATDAAIVAGSIDTSTGYSVAAGLLLGLTDMISVAIEGDYADVDNAGTTADFNIMQVRGALYYRPVSGLTFAAYVGYSTWDVDGAAANVDDDRVEAIFRVQRDW
ncbi:MAG: porin [Hyphomicrobiaceae bacterium]|nr:porin [Hyphomicrobiaceae bacterium]